MTCCRTGWDLIVVVWQFILFPLDIALCVTHCGGILCNFVENLPVIWYFDVKSDSFSPVIHTYSNINKAFIIISSTHFYRWEIYLSKLETACFNKKKRDPRRITIGLNTYFSHVKSICSLMNKNVSQVIWLRSWKSDFCLGKPGPRHFCSVWSICPLPRTIFIHFPAVLKKTTTTTCR